MNNIKVIEIEIETLSQEIEKFPNNIKLLMERGKLYHQNGDFDKSMNDFIRVSTIDPDNNEANQYIAMLAEIFMFRYNDIYNP